jgi:hypothetical protein
MQSHWANSAPYDRRRSPAEYALANRVEHPLNVCLREDAILADVDGWLAREFAPHRTPGGPAHRYPGSARMIVPIAAGALAPWNGRTGPQDAGLP